MKLNSEYKRKAVIALLAYMGLIFIFSVVYWLVWTDNPDAFVINNEINESPKEIIGDYFRNDNKSNVDSKAIASSLQEILKWFENEVSSLKRQQEVAINLSEKINKYENVIKDLREKNLKMSFENKAKEIKKEIESLEEKRKWFENFNKDYLETKKSINIEIAPEILEQINFSIIAINQKILEKELWMFDKEEVKQAFTLFDRDTIYELQKALKDKTDNLESLRSAKEKITQFKADLKKKADRIYRSRSEKLGYIDFLYFSIITSTTTGYGDIIPNRTVVRVCVIIQLMTSLILFGLFLTWFAESFKKNVV